MASSTTQGLADATGGQCTMIADGEDFAPKVGQGYSVGYLLHTYI